MFRCFCCKSGTRRRCSKRRSEVPWSSRMAMRCRRQFPKQALPRTWTVSRMPQEVWEGQAPISTAFRAGLLRFGSEALGICSRRFAGNDSAGASARVCQEPLGEKIDEALLKALAFSSCVSGRQNPTSFCRILQVPSTCVEQAKRQLLKARQRYLG